MSIDRTLRIVVYPHHLGIGGSQLNALELASAVRDRGHFVQIFAAEDGPLSQTVSDLALPLAIAPRHRHRPSLAIAQALRGLCRRERIDIVHAYEWPPCLEAFYGPHLVDRVVIGCTVMSMSVAPFLPKAIPLVVGTQQIGAAVRVHGRSSVDVIEPPVDIAGNHPEVDGTAFRAGLSLTDELLVVVVSRLAMSLKLEGLRRAIQAAEVLSPQTGMRLAIVGDGPARPGLEALARDVHLRTGRRIIFFAGELADPRPAYAAADIVLGMGGSALRALAFAKPVIVLGEHGFADVFTPASAPRFLWQGFYGLGTTGIGPEALITALRPLLHDAALRHRLGQFSRRLVEDRFSLTAAADRQLSVYKAWYSAGVEGTRPVRAAARAASQVIVHKVRQRTKQLISGQSVEDFNTIEMIQRTAAAAGPRD